METNDFAQPDFSNGGAATTLESFLPTPDEGGTPAPAEGALPVDPAEALNKELEGAAKKAAEAIKPEEKPIDPIIGDGKKEEPPIDGEKPVEPAPIVVPDINLEIPEGGIDYKSLTSKLMEGNVWGKIDAFGTEEGEVPFEDMEINEETFLQILEQQKEIQKEELLKDRVSIDGTSEFTKRLIEIEKNGGDVQQALNSYQQVKNPLASLDLTDTKDQQQAVALKLNAQGSRAGYNK